MTEETTNVESSYPPEYFKGLDAGSLRSAEVIVPLVIDLVRPRSVVDVGCGTGAWLSVFISEGVSDVVGVDGDYVGPELLRIPEDRFLTHDLERALSLGRTFDLVTSLEVAEHLSAEAAERFVDSLVSLGPVILFSAATPGQGGHHHVNEQPPSYWADLFGARGYQAIDCLRARIWDNPAVDWWYAQNCLLYVERTHALADRRLARELHLHGGTPRMLTHPRPAMTHAALARQTRADIARILDRSDVCILIDEGGLAQEPGLTCTSLPFMGQDGEHYGPPRDSRDALERLVRARQGEATHLVVTWSCFWWRDFYGDFFDHLERNFELAQETDAVMIFDFRHKPPALD